MYILEIKLNKNLMNQEKPYKILIQLHNNKKNRLFYYLKNKKIINKV